MTAKEYKILKPEHSHLEGDELWDAMEDYMLRQQSGQEVMKSAVPFFKRYQLRWLFYRKPQPSFSYGTNDYTSEKRCAKCKKGVGGTKHGIMWDSGVTYFCPHGCGELIEQKNTNLNHRIYILWKPVLKFIVLALDRLHILRMPGNQRNGLFADEGKYLSHWTMNIETGETKMFYKKRKWWEYIFIEKRNFNF